MKVSIELPTPLQRQHQPEVIKNIYWVDPKIVSAEYSREDEHVIHLEYNDENLTNKARANIETAAVHIIDSIDKTEIKRVFDQTQLTPGYHEDPLPMLQARDWVQVLYPGGYAYHGFFLKLFDGLDRAFRQYALELNCEEYVFPGLLSYDSAVRSNYLSNYTQNVNLVSHVHEDLDSLRGYQKFLKNSKKQNNQSQFLNSPDLICSPTICHHFWQGLSDTKHIFQDLRIGTAVGHCHRYEGRASCGIERLREYTMREIFAIGSPKEVVQFRDKLIDGQSCFMQDYKITGCIETATDPFFVDTYAAKRVYQLGLNLKYEVKVLLPYKDEYLAISSVNYHENFFSNAYKIQAADNKKLHSCCLGWGLDRWCLAVFAQHGLDPKKWPEPLRRLVE